MTSPVLTESTESTYEPTRPYLVSNQAGSYAPREEESGGTAYEVLATAPDPSLEPRVRLVLLRALAAERMRHSPAQNLATARSQEGDEVLRALYEAQLRDMPSED